MAKYTTLQMCWYQYHTGEKFRRKHLEMKFVCTECHYVWDRQAYAFCYCPGCGRRVSEIEEVKDDG